MKPLYLMMFAMLAAVVFAEEASESDISRRNRYRKEAAELEAKRNALKDRIRIELETAETLNVTAELMEGVRKFPPVERERLSEIREFEVGVPRTVRKAASDKSTCVHRWVTLDEGRRYRFAADVKAEDVKDTSVKFGLMVPMPNGKTKWPGCSVGSGTFDWRRITFDYEIPAGAGHVLLLYGLESGSGEVAFRDVSVFEISRVLE